MPLKVVIIEDEKLTARDLAATIRSIDDSAEILPFLHSVDEALYFFKQQPTVDLVFSDIDLGDGLSFEIFNSVIVGVPIIFCTAFDQYMLQAFKTYGIDYILKPFKRSDIEKALDKYNVLKHKLTEQAAGIHKITAQIKEAVATKTKALLIERGEKIWPLPLTDIAYFAVENEAVYAYTFSKERHLLNETLETLEQLDPAFFYRANRQILVNRKVIMSASRHFNRKLLLHLSLPYKENVLVGKLKVSDFLLWLQNTPA